MGLTFLGSIAYCSPSSASFVSSEFTSNFALFSSSSSRYLAVSWILRLFQIAYINSFSLTDSLIFHGMLSASAELHSSSTSFLGAFREEFLQVCRCWDCSDQCGLASLVLIMIAILSLLTGMSCAWVILLTSASAADPFQVRGTSEGQLLGVRRQVRTLLVLPLLVTLQQLLARPCRFHPSCQLAVPVLSCFLCSLNLLHCLLHFCCVSATSFDSVSA